MKEITLKVSDLELTAILAALDFKRRELEKAIEATNNSTVATSFRLEKRLIESLLKDLEGGVE